MKREAFIRHIYFMIFFALLILCPISHGASDGKKPDVPADPNGTGAEEVDVQKFKEKYWAEGKETEMDVVQNRLFSKRHRIELGASLGSVAGDPFLSIYSVGASVGFHLSEFFALHAVAWKALVNPSSALTTLQSPPTSATANTNAPSSYIGGEFRGSLLYGKLSLMGAAIVYFDAYLSVGAGSISTESGSDALVSVGIGQQIHLSRLVALNLDFKQLYYSETILGKGTTDWDRIWDEEIT